jgi:hypothetical protein
MALLFWVRGGAKGEGGEVQESFIGLASYRWNYRSCTMTQQNRADVIHAQLFRILHHSSHPLSQRVLNDL